MINSQDKLAKCFSKAVERESGLKDKVAAKLKAYNDEIEAIQEKVTTLDKQKKDREAKLGRVEEPIKKLLDDKLAMQKKIDQKLLDSCTQFLAKKSDENVVFIMQNFVAILRGQNSSDAFSVELYLKKVEGLNLALNRIDFKAQSVGHVKNLLRELIGERAKKLGIVQEKSAGEYEATGNEFPKHLVDFLIFYKLLIIVSKLCVAKHDEALIIEAIRRCQDQQNKLNGESDALKMKVRNLENIMPSIADGGSNLASIA